MNKKLIVTLAMASAICVSAQADTAYSVTAAVLADASAVAIPQAALAVMVIDETSDGFASLSGPGSAGYSLTIGSLWGNDRVMQIEDLTASGTDGQYLGAFTVSYTGNINANDQIKIYWFPTLTLSSTVLGYSTAYGGYTDQVPIDGSALWALPADTGAVLSLLMLTVGSGAGTVPDVGGEATFTTEAIPEPSTMVLVGLGLLGVAALRRRNA